MIFENIKKKSVDFSRIDFQFNGYQLSFELNGFIVSILRKYNWLITEWNFGGPWHGINFADKRPRHPKLHADE